MKKGLLILLSSIIVAAGTFAKSSLLPELEPISCNGFEYNVDYHISPFSEKAFITITDKTDSELTKVNLIKLYSKLFIPIQERDLQWIFIKKMEVTDNSTIRFYREDNIIFELSLKDNSVKRITPSKTLRLIISNLLLILALVLFTYIIYRLLGREMEMRKKAAEERIRESSKTEASESLYKRDREFTNKMLKRNSATAVFIAFLALCFIILLDILLLSKA